MFKKMQLRVCFNKRKLSFATRDFGISVFSNPRISLFSASAFKLKPYVLIHLLKNITGACEKTPVIKNWYSTKTQFEY
ncbi:MAG: hypothetical protein CSA05_00650 [Bacteroidia bacterium]|nr:MAG: hypothetical protein CSB01_00405 [Bacteroidia bacterium]PIE86406.1 MAG: hypothetical protein CSA05_00650 [Bacteroidia bacterium]